MESLKFTLIGDGSSDEALMNIIKWLLNDLYEKLPTEGIYADFRHLPNPPPKSEVDNQVKFAAKYYPFDILFYHRDAESNKKNILLERKAEILDVIDAEQGNITVCVVPIIMMETWLLIDETAIKRAAGNGNYKGEIRLPSLNKLESLKESKDLLYGLLREASGLKKRNLKTFNVSAAVHLVSEYINDFSSLRALNSFLEFEKDVKKVVDNFLEKKASVK